jgi:GTPase SAR1 family protein
MKQFKDIGTVLLKKVRKVLYMPQIIFSKKHLVYPDNPRSVVEYKDLAPEEELTNASEYYKALDWALNNHRIMNIAIAGPYGSGKSSIIKAYLKKHPELKYINISLANFLEYSDDGNGDLIDLKEGALELGILKQLFYKVNYRKIPQSRYRKLRSIKKKHVALGVFLIAVLAVTICMFVIPDFKQIVLSIVQNAESNLGLARKWIYAISGISFLACFYIISNVIWQFFSRTKIKEVNVGSQATVSTDESSDDDSIFDKNMDEIVYFFEATGYNVVFLEDLDRFNSADIFVKLRELNTILNNYEVIKKRIVFVYAIKDDMFSEKERTKFFEFILPVIPIINATNSGEILLKKMSIDGDNSRMRFDISMDYITLISRISFEEWIYR